MTSMELKNPRLRTWIIVAVCGDIRECYRMEAEWYQIPLEERDNLAKKYAKLFGLRILRNGPTIRLLDQNGVEKGYVFYKLL